MNKNKIKNKIFKGDNIMKNRPFLISVVAFSIVFVLVSILVIEVMINSSGIGVLKNLNLSEKEINFIAWGIEIFWIIHALAIIKIFSLYQKIDNPRYIAKRYWELFAKISHTHFETFFLCLPNQNCEGSLIQMIEKNMANSNWALEQIYTQFKLSPRIINRCSFEAVASLNYSHLKFLVDRRYIIPNIIFDYEGGFTLAHALAEEYGEQGGSPEFLKMALYLREIGFDFDSKDVDGRIPLDIINDSESSPDAQTTLKIVDIFDPKNSNEDVLKKYCKVENK